MKYYHEGSIANREDIERSPADVLGPDIELISTSFSRSSDYIPSVRLILNKISVDTLASVS